MFGKKFHKEVIGYVVAIADMICICIIMYFIIKLDYLSSEYTYLIDSYQITLRDFSVICKDLKLDKFTQDPIIAQMKIWLHIENIMKTIIK